MRKARRLKGRVDTLTLHRLAAAVRGGSRHHGTGEGGAKTDVDEAPSPLTEWRGGVGALSLDVLIMHVRAESAAGDAVGWLAGASTSVVIRHTDGITARSTR